MARPSSSNLTPATNFRIYRLGTGARPLCFWNERWEVRPEHPRPTYQKAERGAPGLRVLNGLDEGRSFEISIACELPGQRAVDKRNRDRPFTDCRSHAFDAAAANVTHCEHARKRGFEQLG